MIKLQDFAREQGVTDRQIQRLLKKYEEELTGHFERKGPNGTWLSDEACEILRSKMKQQPIVVSDAETHRKVEDLMEENRNLLKALNGAKDRIIEMQGVQTRLEAAEKETKLLESFIQDAKAEIRTLTEEKTKEVAKAKQEAVEAVKRAEIAEAELAAYKALPWWKRLAGKR